MFNFLRPQTSGAKISRIAPTEAVSRVKSGDIVLIDVRDGSEVAQGRAEGALHVPMATLRMKCDPSSPEFLPALSKGKPVCLYCASGARSQMAAQMLAGMGYETVYNLGGLRDWHAGGGKITR